MCAPRANSNNKLITLPARLGELTVLDELDVSHNNGLSVIEPRALANSLTKFACSGCPVSCLPDRLPPGLQEVRACVLHGVSRATRTSPSLTHCAWGVDGQLQLEHTHIEVFPPAIASLTALRVRRAAANANASTSLTRLLSICTPARRHWRCLAQWVIQPPQLTAVSSPAPPSQQSCSKTVRCGAAIWATTHCSTSRRPLAAPSS